MIRNFNVSNTIIFCNLSRYYYVSCKIKEYIETKMQEINSLYGLNFSKCTISDNHYCLGQAIDNKEIVISNDLIKMICNGDKLVLRCLFHELYHIKQYNQMCSKENNDDIIKYIKDYLLDQYQKESTSGLEDPERYYLENYDNIYYEVTANIFGIQELKKFLTQNNIKLKSKDLKQIRNLEEEYSIRKDNKTRKMQNVFGRKYGMFNVDKAFDMAIENNPKWLKLYPQLEELYYVQDDKVYSKANHK